MTTPAENRLVICASEKVVVGNRRRVIARNRANCQKQDFLGLESSTTGAQAQSIVTMDRDIVPECFQRHLIGAFAAAAEVQGDFLTPRYGPSCRRLRITQLRTPVGYYALTAR